MSRAEMEVLGWDSCDVILVTGDAYVDHPSFGMALIGRLLEAQGFRVGLIAQPNWRDAEAFRALGAPNLYFGITAGNMDSMVNRYTSDRKIRSDDAYTPDGAGGQRPDRSVIVYTQRCREAYPDVPVVIGGIEASLRRVAHYDYWSEKVRRSVLLDAQAELLVFGNAERAIVEITHRLGAGEDIRDLHDIRGTAFVRRALPAGWIEIDSTEVDAPGRIDPPKDPYQMEPTAPAAAPSENGETVISVVRLRRQVKTVDRDRSVIRLPAFDVVCAKIRCCMRTPRASCMPRPIPTTHGPWCSAMATWMSGSIRRPFRSIPKTWMRCMSCRISAYHTPPMARPRFRPTR